jgi:hypothetical protein
MRLDSGHGLTQEDGVSARDYAQRLFFPRINCNAPIYALGVEVVFVQGGRTEGSLILLTIGAVSGIETWVLKLAIEA